MARRYLNWKKSLQGGAVLLALFVTVSIGFSGCMSFRMKEAEVEEHFATLGEPHPIYFEHRDAEGVLFVAKTGKGPSLVFVHGSPGSWDNYVHMLSDPALNARFTLVSVDRPGFGNSLPKQAEPSLEAQARRIRDAVAAAGAPLPAVWVGHSLGGPVVARLAVDYPEVVAGLVLVAPSIDPELEERKWFNWVGKFPPVKWGLSREWRNSNEEIFPLRSELVGLGERLGELRTPTVVLQGDRDMLVPKENATYVKRALPEGVVEVRILEGVNHFIPWTNAEDLKSAIDRVFERSERLNPAESLRPSAAE